MNSPAMGRARSGPRARGPARPLGLESLEDRCLLSAGAAAVGAARLEPAAGDRILVQFRPGVAVPAGLSLLAGTALGPQVPGSQNLFAVNLSAGVTAARAVAAYKADPRVVAAAADAALTVARVPNDPFFGQQWADQNTGQNGGTPGADIHATQAWDVTTGSSSTVVAVMDTGIDYDHPDLYQNVWLNQAEIPLSRLRNLVDYYHDGYISWRDLNDPRNQGFGKITDVNHDGRIDAADVLAPMVLDASGNDTGLGGWAFAGNTRDGDTAHPNDYVGWNFVTNTNNPFDDNGHGTHVSGTIGASGNNGVGVAGLDWQVQIMACKFIGADGVGGIYDFVAALNYSLAHGARITNNSWAGAPNNSILAAAVGNARARGQIFVAAAGNDAADNDVTPSYPSGFNFDNVVGVAATDRNGRLASFSNYGARSVAVAAPGVEILSTTPNNSYANYTGTSMATPMVTGVLALVWGQHPSWTYSQVIAQVLNNVTPLAALQGKVRSGGLLNAAKAVGYVAPTPSTPPRVVSSTSSGPYGGTLGSIRLTFDQPVNPATLTYQDITLTRPDGLKVPLTAVRAVPNSGNRVFDLLFPTQVMAGTYRLRVGPDVENYHGTELGIYQASFVLGPAVYTVGTTTPVAIPDVSRAVSALTVNASFLVGKVTVKVNIQHTWDGDLYVHLQAPDGTDVLLSNRNGGGGHNYQNTVFDDAAAVSIRAGQAPFAGSYRPEAALAGLAGKNARGVWRLWVEDRAPGDTGVVLGWSITFSPAGGSPGTAALPGGAAPVAASLPRPTAPAAPAGTGAATRIPTASLASGQVAAVKPSRGTAGGSTARAASLAVPAAAPPAQPKVTAAVQLRALDDLFARLAVAGQLGGHVGGHGNVPAARPGPGTAETADPVGKTLLI